MNRVLIVALRVLIVILLAGMLFGQLRFLPVVVANDLVEHGAGEVAVLYPAIGIALVACAEATLVAIWVLLSMVRKGAIFSERAFRWVDLIVYSGIAATVLALFFLLHWNWIAPEIPPGILGIVAGLVLALATFVLLMLVMRGLLRSATELRGELDEVV
jgi:hypothetical protein